MGKLVESLLERFCKLQNVSSYIGKQCLQLSMELSRDPMMLFGLAGPACYPIEIDTGCRSEYAPSFVSEPEIP